MGRAKRPKAEGSASELAVLFPDRELPLSCGTVTVRELRFEEQLRHHQALAALADALAEIPADALQDEAGINRVLDVLAAHWAGIRPVVAEACGQSEAWVGALSGEDGEALLVTWWCVNQGFFLRRLLRPTLMRQAMRRAGDASSPHSSPQATAAPSLAATPPAS